MSLISAWILNYPSSSPTLAQKKKKRGREEGTSGPRLGLGLGPKFLCALINLTHLPRPVSYLLWLLEVVKFYTSVHVPLRILKLRSRNQLWKVSMRKGNLAQNKWAYNQVKQAIPWHVIKISRTCCSTDASYWIIWAKIVRAVVYFFVCEQWEIFFWFKFDSVSCPDLDAFF